MTVQVQGKNVQAMFSSIADRYDLTNTVLSGGIHHLWKKKMVNLLPEGGTVLDLCTGTGDLLPLLAKRHNKIIGADFCEPMLKVAAKRGYDKFSDLLVEDAMKLSFNDNTFDSVTVAFGVRNFEDLNKGLTEILRVLKVNGTLVILEFGQPKIPLWGSVYAMYSRFIMPHIGGVLTGNKSAYEYLPKTASEFPCRERFVELLSKIGFTLPVFYSLTGGIAYLYSAKRTV